MGTDAVYGQEHFNPEQKEYIIIGDIHASTKWKQIVDKHQTEHIIFVGDYVDTYEKISPEKQAKNLKDIIDFKNNNLDRCTLLIGNHDYHYTRYALENYIQYSGFSRGGKILYMHLIESLLETKQIQACKVIDNIIISHAGISTIWCETYNINPDNLEEEVNQLLHTDISAFDFLINDPSNKYFPNPYGDNIWQSPLWIRPKSLAKANFDNTIQIFGHTNQQNITYNNGLICVDTLEISGEYLKVTNDKFIVCNINDDNEKLLINR